MQRLADFVLSHKRLVVAAWLLPALIGFATLSHSTGALTQRYDLPGYAGYEASQAIARAYGTGGGSSQPLVAVAHVPGGVAAHRTELGAALDGVARALPGSRIASYASTGDRTFVSADGKTTFALVYPPLSQRTGQAVAGSLRKVQGALAGARVGGSPIVLTGADALGKEAGTSKGPNVLIESLLGAVGALAVLVFVFGSPLALVPLAVALAAIPTTFLLVWGLTSVTSVHFLVEYFIALIGLGVAVDYALLLVSRWREERASGDSDEDAVRRAVATAGRAVLVSGTAVSIGLFSLVALPVPFLRSIGFAGLLIPLVSSAAALTLLPAMLAAVGPRLDRWRLRRTDRATGRWMRWADLVVRHRLASLTVAGALLVALLVPAFSLQLGQAQAGSLAHAGPAHDALRTLERAGIGDGVLSPLEVLTTAGAAPHVAAALGRVDGVRGAVAPTTWRRSGTALVDVLPAADPASSAGSGTLGRVRDAAAALGVPAQVGGVTSWTHDFVSAVYGSFPEMLALLAVISFLLLARAFRSIVLPLKALALNVLSIGAAWGVVVLVWQEGHGSHLLASLPATHSTTAWIPLIVFAFLFGLSMDYEVFILARMREEYDRTGSTSLAVAGGLGRTGRLVTSAALILFLTFVAMGSGPDTDVKTLATGFAAGILLDATIVRAVLVPALVALLGRWNWWFPTPAARLLRVAESVPEQPLPSDV